MEKPTDDWHLVLSRKGFDSSAGGDPSPILPDGRMVSLPIPDPASPVTYSDLRIRPPIEGADTMGRLVRNLTRERISPDYPAHLDPDLDPRALERPSGWRPLFGQTGAAQGHLRNQGIEEGDLILFYGWFRRAEKVDESFSFAKDARDLHVLFGWFQIGGIYDLSQESDQAPEWTRYHPHFFGNRGSGNTLYVARDTLKIGSGDREGLPGAGIFPTFHPELCLTAPGETRTVWRLPRWFYPGGERPSLTYHSDMGRWSREGDYVLLKAVSRGQEFVLEATHYPESVSWVLRLIREHGMI